MEDTVKSNVLEMAELLKEHRGEDVIVLDISRISGWTDFFIISTVRSNVHLKGLLRTMNDFFTMKNIQPLNLHKNLKHVEGWILIDCGDFVIHLMEKEQRAFYELEKLWFKSELIYSSKSS